MSAPRIKLAPGTFFYPHADRVIFRDGSPWAGMSWPLTTTNGQHATVHNFAVVQCKDPALRSALFALLAVDNAYGQMTLRDGRAKRDHVCAMLRKAARSPVPGTDDPTNSSRGGP